MSSCVAWTWLLAIALACVDLALTLRGEGQNNLREICMDNGAPSPWDFGRKYAPMLKTLVFMVVVSNVVAFALACGCCGGGVRGLDDPRRDPGIQAPAGSVNIRALRRVFRYCVVNVVTWLPYWLSLWFPNHEKYDWHGDPWDVAAMAAISLHGASTIWGYASMDRHIKRVALMRQSGEVSLSQSGVHEERELGDTERGGLRRAEIPKAEAAESFHVFFALEPEVRTISFSGRPELYDDRPAPARGWLRFWPFRSSASSVRHEGREIRPRRLQTPPAGTLPDPEEDEVAALEQARKPKSWKPSFLSGR